MAEQLSVSLQPLPSVNKEEDNLKSLIERISQQRGLFRDVTSTKLEQEIRRAESGVVDDDEVSTEIEEIGEYPTTKQEQVLKAKEEMMKQVSQARNESAMALDFVSLLLSTNAPSSGMATMSPYLQQHVPSGSLAVEWIQTPHITEIESRTRDMVSMGWRMQSLGNSADSLLASANRLRSEVERETTYWNQILTVKEGGWSLCRLPRERHTLAVRYGFAEAHADFRDRGLAALRRDALGNLVLDRRPQSKQHQQLRVRILQRGKPLACTATYPQSTNTMIATTSAAFNTQDTTSTSATTATNYKPREISIATHLLQARDSVFDAELHLEVHREARLLLGHGVRCEGSRVLMPYKRDNQIEIDLADVDADPAALINVAPQGLQSQDSISQSIPYGIGLALRLLLSEAHRQSLRKRSQIPAPLKGSTKTRPVYPLLKPIVNTLEAGRDIMDVFEELVKGPTL